MGAINIVVLGAGAWGSALANALAQTKRHSVLLWGRDSGLLHDIVESHENTRYLPGVLLDPTLQVTSNWQSAIKHLQKPGDLIIVATSVEGLRPTLQQLAKDIGNIVERSIGVVWLCKGIEEKTELLPHQIVYSVLGTQLQCGALSGPSFASEVAQGLPVALTFATRSINFAEQVVNALHSRLMRVYATDDLIGVEIGGAVKNVLAIATGIAEGLGLGLNARAALITRGLAEIIRLGTVMGARPETFMGLAGVGDLILTCTGGLSRNRKVGLLLAEGLELTGILQQLGHVAEGVYCARSVLDQAQFYKTDMPIVKAVCQVLFEEMTPQDAIQSLLARDPAYEVGFNLYSIRPT